MKQQKIKQLGELVNGDDPQQKLFARVYEKDGKYFDLETHEPVKDGDSRIRFIFNQTHEL